MEPFCPSLLGHVPSCRDRCCPGPDLAAPWAAHPCRGTWSLSSSSPSVAMLPEGFFRGGLERRRTRLTLSRITWMQTGGQPQSHTQAAPPVSSPQSARTCCPLPCPLGGHWADSGDSTSAGHSRHSQVTKGCWGDPSSSHCLLLGIPRCGGCNSPLRWPRTEPPPWGALPHSALHPLPPPRHSPEGSAHLIDIVQDLQDGENAGTNEQAHLPPDVPWGGGGDCHWRCCAALWEPGVGQRVCGPCQGCQMERDSAAMSPDGGAQGRGGRKEGAEDTRDRVWPAACHHSASLWLAPALPSPSPSSPMSSQGYDPELYASGSHR